MHVSQGEDEIDVLSFGDGSGQKLSFFHSSCMKKKKLLVLGRTFVTRGIQSGSGVRMKDLSRRE